MKLREADILILPGIGGGIGNYWYNRWAGRIATAKRIEQDDFDAPDPARWAARIIRSTEAATRPVVLVAHSAGTLAAVKNARQLHDSGAVAAFLVAPPDPDACRASVPAVASFKPVPIEPLPFPSYVVASRNDPYCSYASAGNFAAGWGSLLVDAGEAGHLNAESGHGPWPEGLMSLARLMNGL